MMRRLITKLSVCVIALTLVVPPSYARRLGGGRSIGRQTQTMRPRSPAPVQRQQVVPAAPPFAQQRSAPVQAPPLAAPRPALPGAPVQNVARPAGRPWGGMLGGALVGLGLGSLLSSGDRNSVNPSATNQNGAATNPDGTASGTGSDGTTAAGPGVAGAAQPAEQPREGIFGHPFLLALLALLGFLFIRRARRRALQR